jgi:ABC-type glycerol-3-phosphate transport system permease component
LSLRDNVRVAAYFGRDNRRFAGLSTGRDTEAHTDAALKAVGLTGNDDVPAGTLPVLDRKLLMLAGALATRPRLLLMDEPVGGLNSLGRLIKDLAPQAVVLVTATSLGLVWAYLVRFVAVALQSVQSGYARIPTSLDESARMLGSTGLALAWRVHWPLLRRSTAAAALLVFVDVMKELPATLVLRPFNTDTLAVMAYQLARDERLGEAALPALALVLVGLIPVVMLSRTLRTRQS